MICTMSVWYFFCATDKRQIPHQANPNKIMNTSRTISAIITGHFGDPDDSKKSMLKKKVTTEVRKLTPAPKHAHAVDSRDDVDAVHFRSRCIYCFQTECGTRMPHSCSGIFTVNCWETLVSFFALLIDHLAFPVDDFACDGADKPNMPAS